MLYIYVKAVLNSWYLSFMICEISLYESLHIYLESLVVGYLFSSSSTFLFPCSRTSCRPVDCLTSVSWASSAWTILFDQLQTPPSALRDFGVTLLSPEYWALSPLLLPQFIVPRIQFDMVGAPTQALNMLHSAWVSSLKPWQFSH